MNITKKLQMMTAAPRWSSNIVLNSGRIIRIKSSCVSIEVYSIAAWVVTHFLRASLVTIFFRAISVHGKGEVMQSRAAKRRARLVG
jgi:hypothetical protein